MNGDKTTDASYKPNVTYRIFPIPGEDKYKIEEVEGELLPAVAEETKPNGNGLKRMWNRRFKSFLIWLGAVAGLILGVKYLGWDKELVKLTIEKSTWVLGLLIIGLSGTDLMKNWIDKYK